MRIGTFLETRKITVEGTCCLQVAICLTFLQIILFLQGNYVNLWKHAIYHIISSDEDEPLSHLPPWDLFLFHKGTVLLQKELTERQTNSEINTLFLHKYNM